MARVFGAAGYGPVVSREQWSQGADYVCQARVTDSSGTGAAVVYEGNALLAANVTTVSCTVYDLGTCAQIAAGTNPTPTVVATPAITSAAFAALAADNLWASDGQPIDSIGRNFTFTIVAATLSQPHVYRVQVTLVFASGAKTMQWWHEIDAQDGAVV